MFSKAQAVYEAVDELVERFGVSKPDVRFESATGTMGYFDRREGKVVLDLALHQNVADAVFTAAHEMRHAYQAEAGLSLPFNHPMSAWLYPPTEYRAQPREWDADSFAVSFVEEKFGPEAVAVPEGLPELFEKFENNEASVEEVQEMRSYPEYVVSLAVRELIKARGLVPDVEVEVA